MTDAPQMKIDVSQVAADDMAEAIRRAMLAMSAGKRGVATRGPDSVGKPFGERQKRRASGKINPEVGLAVQFEDRTEWVAVRRAIKRISGARKSVR